MIRILKGNHRKAYFQQIARILSDGQERLCNEANHNCNACQYADVCDSLMNAEGYCNRIASRMKP